MRYVVTGSHGLIGSSLVASLEADGHEVLRLVRSPDPTPGPSSPPSPAAGAAAAATTAPWDPLAGRLDPAVLVGVDGVVHLAGAGIADKRWNPARKREIRDSRVLGTRTIVDAMRKADSPPAVLVSGSAIGFYGDRGDEELDETTPRGGGFLARVCEEWEAEARRADEIGVRVVTARTGIVQSPAGGALGRQLPLFRVGAGGRLGSGNQWQSWITLEDEVAALRFALESDQLDGPVNLTAPHPVTNADYTKALAKVLGRPALFAVPKVALDLALGAELVGEALLASQRVLPRRLETAGFAFASPELAPALAVLLGRT